MTSGVLAGKRQVTDSIMARRPRLPKVDPTMQRWCAALEEELARWPHVTSRPMFGLTAYYRDRRIFAAIPRTRAVDTPFSFLIKLPRTAGARIRADRGPGALWSTFTMETDADLSEALAYLSRAYDRAADAPRSTDRPPAKARGRR